MKMPKLPAAAYVVLSALLLFVIGWLMYPRLLGVIVSGGDVMLIQQSIEALFINGLWAALSFALLGAVTSGCFLFLRHRTVAHPALGSMVGLTLVAFGSTAGWFFYMQHKITFISTAMVSAPPPMVLAIEDIPVYEAGMLASIAVFLVTLLLAVWAARKKRPL